MVGGPGEALGSCRQAESGEFVVRPRDGCTRGCQQDRGYGPARSMAAPAFRLHG